MDSQDIRVKICGIRALDDALVAAKAGADFIGMVFVPERHRRITPKEAKAIVDGVRNSGGPVPRIVGLFADQSIEEVAGVVEFCGLDLAQLCGQETVEFAGQIGCDVIKVVHVAESATASDDAGTGMTDPLLAEDGVVIPHVGITGDVDLHREVHDWSDPVAKIVIERM